MTQLKNRLYINTFTCVCLAVALGYGSAQVVAANVEAFAGQPFGVAKVTVSLSKADFGLPVESHAFSIQEVGGRTFYPAFSTKRVLPVLQSLIGIDNVTPPQNLTVYFLFTGQAPLEVTVYTPTPQRVRVVPGPGRRGSSYSSLLNQWWRAYHTSIRDQEKQGDYPAVVETYLSTMLSRRLQMGVPPLSREAMADREALSPGQSLFMLLGSEQVRTAMMKAVLNNEILPEAANLPLPAPIKWQPLLVPEPNPDVSIEPIALQVPRKCFYIRFGELANYIWLNKLLEENGGDLSKLITNRGVQLHLSESIQTQLALKQSALAEVFGSTVVQDLALIGRDTYTREGGALGMLFHAKNNLLMSNDLNTNRNTALRENKDHGASLKNIKVNGVNVSFLSTPDNRLRSFYAQRGNFHLVTTSRAIVEDFLSIENGVGSLGTSKEFRYARTLMPVDRKDTIFVYLSSEFFRGLFSPQYHIELRRRIQAITEMELLKMAQAAAVNEGMREVTVDGLIRQGFLPRVFEQRADQSRIDFQNETYVDSLRGKLGSFLPIPDVPVDKITATEHRDFDAVRFYHMSKWQQMDPVMVGINRFKLNDEGLERIAIDARMAPFGKNKYGSLTKYLGPPLPSYISPIETNIADVNLVLKGDYDLLHHYAIGIQDLPFPVGSYTEGGLINTLRMMQSTPGYLTAWPKPGIIDKLPIIGNLAAPDINGYSKLLFGLWRREFNDFSTLSFQYDILAHVTPQLHIVEDEHPAQARIHIGDISNSHLTPLANGLAQSWAMKGSLGNARFLHAISEQLGIPREQAKDFADELLNLDLVCSLDGEYQIQQENSGLVRWVSTAWKDDRLAYESNLMRWFRGLNARVNVSTNKLVAHAEIDMQRDKPEPKLTFPSFDFFGGGSAPKKESEKPKKKVPDMEELPKPAAKKGKQF